MHQAVQLPLRAGIGSRLPASPGHAGQIAWPLRRGETATALKTVSKLPGNCQAAGRLAHYDLIDNP